MCAYDLVEQIFVRLSDGLDATKPDILRLHAAVVASKRSMIQYIYM